jgi:hypothetical protein
MFGKTSKDFSKFSEKTDGKKPQGVSYENQLIMVDRRHNGLVCKL